MLEEVGETSEAALRHKRTIAGAGRSLNGQIQACNFCYGQLINTYPISFQCTWRDDTHVIAIGLMCVRFIKVVVVSSKFENVSDSGITATGGSVTERCGRIFMALKGRLQEYIFSCPFVRDVRCSNGLSNKPPRIIQHAISKDTILVIEVFFTYRRVLQVGGALSGFVYKLGPLLKYCSIFRSFIRCFVTSGASLHEAQAVCRSIH